MSRFRPEPNFATVISLIALFVALGGGAYAAVKLKSNQVKSKHIAPDAATGADVSEGTLGTVPSATNATNATNAANATNAGNAATVNGVSAADLQLGDGVDAAVATVLIDGESGGIALFEGALGFGCDATPTLLYSDQGGDPFPTDLWINGTHQAVNDDAAITPASVPLESTHQVHLWGGAGIVAQVVASIAVDTSANPDECTVAFTSQENTEDGPFAFSARAARDRTERAELPEDWVRATGRE